MTKRKRTIETDAEGRRPLKAILDDARHLYELALGRVWKGNPHPDFTGAAKALTLEAELSGYVGQQKPPKGAGDGEGLNDRDLDERMAEHLRQRGHVVELRRN